jgi:PKD repeat protein
MRTSPRLFTQFWRYLLILIIAAGPALMLYAVQPTPTARGKAAARPIFTPLTPPEELAQTLALADGRVLAYTTGKRTEVFVIKAVTAGQFTAPASACATADCRQVEIFDYDNSQTIAAIVNVDTREVLDVLQIKARPGINERLSNKAIELIIHHPAVEAALGRKPVADELVPMEAGYVDSACDTGHVCAAGTLPAQDAILWVIVDLTEEKIIGLNWTNVPLDSTPGIYLQRPMEAPTDCTDAGVVNRDGWTMDYATTGTDAFRVYNVRFNNTLVISNAKLVEWHADYGSSGYVDATGCSPSGGFPIYPFGNTMTNTLVYTPTGEVVGFELVRDFRMSNWGNSCNYRYEQHMQFFKDGRFRITGGAYGKGCGTNSLYRPLMRIDLAVNGDNNDAWGNWTGASPAWARQTTETWWLQDKAVSPEGYKWSITDTVSNVGYYVVPGNGQFGYNGGDVPPITSTNALTDRVYLYLTRHNPAQGDTDLGAVGACCNDDHQQGPHNYLNGEDTSDTNLVIWYIPQMLTNASAPYRCWTVTTTNYSPCFGGPMFVPMTPPAAFTHNGPTPVGETARFTATAPLLSPANYQWNFGDGAVVSGTYTPTTGAPLTATHVYTTSGNYTVTLTLGNATGSNNASQPIVIEVGSAPQAQFTAPAFGAVGAVLTFSNTSPNQAALLNTWNFGDGVVQVNNAVLVTHTYTAPGAYTVILTATNEIGSDTANAVVNVDYAPQAQFTAPATATVGQAVTFTNQSTGPGSLSYVWNFGDGVTSTLTSPTHAYSATGPYTVTLMVTNAYGTHQIQQAINIIPWATYLPVTLFQHMDFLRP